MRGWAPCPGPAAGEAPRCRWHCRVAAGTGPSLGDPGRAPGVAKPPARTARSWGSSRPGLRGARQRGGRLSNGPGTTGASGAAINVVQRLRKGSGKTAR